MSPIAQRPARAPAPRPTPQRPPAARPQHLTSAPLGARLHVGCGPKRLDGWINADAVASAGVDAVVDLHAMRLPASTFAVIYGSHVLEHCWPADTPRILGELREALQPGGTLRLSVPDLRLVLANCVESKVYGGEASALSVLYGGNFSATTPPADLHRQAFWKERLGRLLVEAGFVNVREWTSGQYAEIDALRDYATWPRGADGKSTISLNMEAERPGRLAYAPPTSAAGVDVSVLLGTVGRPQMLRECIEAVRASITGTNLKHEIVVAYGADDEPSLPWLREQPDVVPILGGMDGAIEAFNRAYAASRGRYVCQINDDVLVDGNSIARAVAHLDADPRSAGVVFQFDRADGKGYRHERLRRSLHPNQMVVRRDTCEAVAERIGGFWGDAAHRTDKTYGGDSAFGAVCHHLGLRLDSIAGVTCRDRCNKSQDALRERNRVTDPTHWPRWNALYAPMLQSTITATADEWPRLYVPRPGMEPRRSPVAAGPPLRLLHLSLEHAREPQIDMRRALAAMGPAIDMPWYPLTPERERDILAAARAHRPDVVFAQVQSDSWSPAFVAALRAAVGPSCTIVEWTGDVRTPAAQPVERWLVRLAGGVDLVLADNTTYPRKLALDEKVPAACGYLGCGIDPDLNPCRDQAPENSSAVFLGTNYRHLDGGERDRLFAGVARELPDVLAVYGSGWSHPFASPFVEQGRASEIMRSAAVTISTSLFQDLGRYSSDRLKRALASGAVVAVRRFPDMEGLGLEPGRNCLAWSTEAELIGLLRDWTRPERAGERAELRRQAAHLAHRRFTWDRVVEELLAIVRDYRLRTSGNPYRIGAAS